MGRLEWALHSRRRMPTMKRLIPLLFAGWVFACINVPEIEPKPVPPPPEESDPPDSRAPLGDLTVSITDPVEKAYTSTMITLTVEVRGGVADTVQLLKEGELLATLSSPFRYTWDTTSEAERDYALMARATRAGKVFTSAPVTVVVDRTNLQVASRSPANDATNVDYSQPIQVLFTKPVKEATVSDTTVSFAVAGVLAEKTLTLSSDGKILTIKPKERPALPAKFSIGLSRGITDMAGNALVVPITPWGFEVPDWYSFGGALQAIGRDNTRMNDPTIIVDAHDNPLVAWSEELTPGGRTSIFVYKWDGKAFTPMGGAINGTSTGSAYHPSMALAGDGNPVVAWHESDGLNENIYVKRWIDSEWQTVGTGALSAENDTRPSPIPTPAINPSLAITGDNIYVSWEEMTTGSFTAIFVWKSSGGKSFFGVGPTSGLVNAVPGKTSGRKPSLALNTDNQPVVAFEEENSDQSHAPSMHVMQYQNGKWTHTTQQPQEESSGHYAGGLKATPESSWPRDCSLSIDTENTLHLAWTEESYLNGPHDTQAFQSTSPQVWKRTGSPLSAKDGHTAASNVKIATTNSRNRSIIWEEFSWDNNGITQLYFSTWNNDSWSPTANINNKSQQHKNTNQSTLAMDKLGRATIAWTEGSGELMHVIRHNK